MRFRLRFVLLATLLVGHYRAKPSWMRELCNDGSTPVTCLVPFTIITDFDDGDSNHRRIHVGIMGYYACVRDIDTPGLFNGTRHCYVPALSEIEGSRLRVMIRGSGHGHLYVQGTVETERDRIAVEKVIREHTWSGQSCVYWDVEVRETWRTDTGWRPLQSPEGST